MKMNANIAVEEMSAKELELILKHPNINTLNYRCLKRVKLESNDEFRFIGNNTKKLIYNYTSGS